jgi:phosphatidylglycerophosphate synthase
LIISLFCVGALTDLLDGSVARGLKKETKIGALLDPAADRILIIPIAIYSLFTDHKWLLLWLLLLEIINALSSIYAHGKNIFIESNIFGKVKMVLQSIVFVAILVFWPKTPNMFFIYILWFTVILIIVSIYFKILEIKKIVK